MIEFKVNGKTVSAEDNDKKLLAYLRDDLKLTSVKDGCSEGACGTCTIIIDGKAARACIPTLAKMAGKSVVTPEGLTEREKEVYSYCFSMTGAVQCGFCIPGMVMSAKALIDSNPSPSPQDIKKAIRGNVCRCTGYVKIEEAIMKAAEFFRENKSIPSHDGDERVGRSLPRVDARDKVLGTGKYADDITVADMAYARAVRPPAARCRVVSISKEKALKIPGVLAVYTADDIPGSRYIGHLQKDWPVMIAAGEETRYIGDAVALVVTREKSLLAEACAAVEIEYEILKPVTDVFEAMEDGAPQIHGQGFMQFGKRYVPENNILSYQEVKRGDANAAFSNAAFISEHDYYTPPTEHAFMEPECAVAVPQDDDGVMVYTGGQGVYDEYREICEMLGIEQGSGRVRIQSAYVGGGFGGKEDMSVQHHAALCAYLLRKPVKVLFSRQESINVHPKRHAMYMNIKLACDKDGNFLAMRARIVSDSGAYASLAGPVLQRACTHAGGPYNYQNMDIEGRAVITNNPPGGAFRGFGVTQSCFAVESAINDLAAKAGISPWEIRYKNAIRPGQSLPNGQLADENTAMAEALEAVKDYYEEYDKKDGYYPGIACAMKNAGLGVGVPDTGRCILLVKDGKVHIRTSAAPIGQGLQTVLVQIVCETLGAPLSKVIIAPPDTKFTPDSGTTTASRQTLFTGEAVRRAAEKLKVQLDAGKTLDELDGHEYPGEFSFDTDPIGSSKPNPVSHAAYSYAAQVAVIGDDGRVVSTMQAIDVGRAINPRTLEGQFEGGTAMCMGYALTENFPLKDGVPQVKYGTLGLLRSTDMPEIICRIIGKGNGDSAFGAKGAGEIAAITFAPAVQNAYFKKDGVFRTKLPLENTPYSRKK